MLKLAVEYLIYNLINLDPGSRLGTSVNFFVYDSVKILFLIFGIIFLISFLRTFLPADKMQKIYGQQRWGLGNLMASLFGAVTPFCSCSSIPLFIGFLQARVPVGIAFSFIITSPLVNEVLLIMMGGMFGWKIAGLYALAGILIGVISGVVIDKLNLDKEIILKTEDRAGKKLDLTYLPKDYPGKIKYAYQQSKTTFKKLWWVILLGVGLGAVIHGYVPEEVFTQYLNTDSWLAIPIAVLIGIPLYAGCSTMVPIAFAFTVKGVSLGTALAFLMSVAGLSTPEALMLKRVLSFKLLVIFFGIVGLGIIIVGYLFNLLGL